MLLFAGAILVVFVLILIDIPIAFSFGSVAFAFAYLTDRDLNFLLPYALWQAGGFALLALPLFILTGSVMIPSGISDRMINFINAFVGHVKGALGVVTIVACALFGAMSGSASSAIAAVGTVMIPKMADEGYPRGYVASLVAVSSVLTILVPPSIPMILFALAGRLPVTACFLSTVGAAFVLIIVFSLLNFHHLRNHDIRVAASGSFKEFAVNVRTHTVRGIPALILPVIMLGGIYGGVFTPTEAAAVCLTYALAVGFLSRRLTLANTADAIVRGAAVTGAVMIILLFIFVMTRAMVLEQIPGQIALWLTSISDNKLVLMLLINVILLLIGMVVDDASGSILAAIVLLPVANEIGIHPIHFAAIVGVNIAAGNITPPCAPLLYLAGAVGKASLIEMLGPTLKFLLIGYLPVILLVTYVPDLALFLPRLLLGIG